MSTVTTYANLPILNVIKQLSENKTNFCFQDLKDELERKDENNNNVYCLTVKEIDDLCMIFYNNTVESKDKDLNIIELENSCRSVVLNKNTLEPIFTQYNRIIYNDDAVEFLKDKDWNNVVVQKSFEGTLIVVFCHNDKWFVTTRRCLNAQNSTWIKNNSYYDMFVDAMNGKFTFDDLDKDLCYHFVLVHHKNRNIVSYTSADKEYKEIYHILTTCKGSLKEVEGVGVPYAKYIDTEQFASLDELNNSLQQVNKLDMMYQKVTMEGYVLKYYTGELHNSPFVTLKIQTPIYSTLIGLKPNNSNIHQCFLELYQKDKLNEFLPYFTRYGNETTKRIHLSMQNMAKEVLDLYHMTRNKNNVVVYKALPEQYKKVLYSLHGLYIELKKNSDKPQTSINVFNVYNFLKKMESNDLRQLYYDRISMIDSDVHTFLNRNCIHTITQSTLMFKNK